MNIRDIVGRSIDNPLNYYMINREERNYAAIFYSALCRKDNLRRFLNRIEATNKISADYGMYFEYAYLRDLWVAIKLSPNEIKRQIIKSKLNISNIDEIMDGDLSKEKIFEINRIFGVSGTPSTEHIQFPGKWSIKKFESHFDKTDFERICKFKWSFNIKPDIVIQLSKDFAVCIEAKHQSKEGSYPSSKEDIEIFDRKKATRVTQRALQYYMMKDLLGIDIKPVFLVSNMPNNPDSDTISWKDAFNVLDLDDMPYYAHKMIEIISNCT